MRTRILLAALLTAGLAAVTPTAHSLSPCKAATAAEGGASDIVGGELAYNGTSTPGPLDPSLGDDDLSSGRVTGFLETGAKPCSTITYTVVAYDDSRSTTVLGEPTLVEVARTTSYVRGEGNRLQIAFDIPEHPGLCLQLRATTSAGVTVLDTAPDVDYNTSCLNEHGGGGTQYWN